MSQKLAYFFLFSFMQLLATAGAFAQDITKAPVLQGASSGTIGDTTTIQGINTAGTVRGCNLSNLEGLLNIIANGVELAGIIVGSFIIIKLIVKPIERSPKRLKKNAALAAAWISGGLLFPSTATWFIATARDLNLFS